MLCTHPASLKAGSSFASASSSALVLTMTRGLNFYIVGARTHANERVDYILGIKLFMALDTIIAIISQE